MEDYKFKCLPDLKDIKINICKGTIKVKSFQDIQDFIFDKLLEKSITFIKSKDSAYWGVAEISGIIKLWEEPQNLNNLLFIRIFNPYQEIVLKNEQNICIDCSFLSYTIVSDVDGNYNVKFIDGVVPSSFFINKDKPPFYHKKQMCVFNPLSYNSSLTEGASFLVREYYDKNTMNFIGVRIRDIELSLVDNIDI